MKFPKYKVRHKKEGWTGEIEITDIKSYAYASHRQVFQAEITLYQDSEKPNGEYVEDPDCGIDDLEILEVED